MTVRPRPAMVASCLVGACGGFSPLAAPLPDEVHQVNAVRVAVDHGDLPQLAETLRSLAGTSIDLAAAPTPIASGQFVLGAISGALAVAGVSVAWVGPGELQLDATSAPFALALAVGRAGEPACALQWSVQSASARVRLRVVRTPAGATQAVLAAAPELKVQAGKTAPSDPCLQPLPSGAALQIDAAVYSAVQTAWLPRLSDAGLHVLRAIAPAGLAAGGQWALGSGQGAVQVQTIYPGPTGATPAALGKNYATFSLSLATLADRDPCAPDVPGPPLAVVETLAPAPSPLTKAVVRRALVVHQSALVRLAWSAARAGAFCRSGAVAAVPGVPLQWASAVAPELAGWVDDAAAHARLLPHATPVVELVDLAAGPAVAWQLPDATLEIAGRSGGVQAVVFAVRGRVYGVLRPLVTGAGQLALHFESGGMDSAVVSSPIAGGTVSAQAAALDALVRAALQGMFAPDPVLPLSLLLPAGTVATDVRRSGDSLWLWLDGGVGKR
ncbi:MAG: hypothetical protein FJ100_12845 [Deltaproteobacteria bacterium]|nr:hypothetical protein [Deltaproteobacteria bacterium]